MHNNIYGPLETEVDIFTEVNESGAFDEEEFMYALEFDNANIELRILYNDLQERYKNIYDPI